MSATYPPGTDATATVRGRHGIRVMRNDGVDAGAETHPWVSVRSVNGTRYHSEDDVTDVRVLPVIDLPEADLWNLIGCLRGHGTAVHDRVAAQIQASMSPPPPPEPMGVGSVRYLSGNRMAVRRTGRGSVWFVVPFNVDGMTTRHTWAEIAAHVIDPSAVQS